MNSGTMAYAEHKAILQYTHDILGLGFHLRSLATWNGLVTWRIFLPIILWHEKISNRLVSLFIKIHQAGKYFLFWANFCLGLGSIPYLEIARENYLF